jgi:hypothetical protein
VRLCLQKKRKKKKKKERKKEKEKFIFATKNSQHFMAGL